MHWSVIVLLVPRRNPSCDALDASRLWPRRVVTARQGAAQAVTKDMSALPAIGDMSGQCGATKSLRGVKAQRVVTTGAFRIHFRNKLWPSCHASNCALMRSSATALVYRGLGVLVARCPMSRPHTKNHQRPSVHMRPAAKLALVTFCSPCSPKFHRLFDRPTPPCVARGAGAAKRKAAVMARPRCGI